VIVKKRKAERRKAHRETRETEKSPIERRDPRGMEAGKNGNEGSSRHELEERRTRRRRFERRKSYEVKLPYERWEAGEVWKARMNSPEALRRKANQGERSGWIRGKLDEEAGGLRYYEAKPREYRTRVESGQEKAGKTSKKPRTEAGSEEIETKRAWGFWKAYEAEEAVRVGRWKKTIVQKKAVALGRDPRIPWDRGGRARSRGEAASREKRVTRTQARRRVRNGGNPGSPVERERDPGKTPGIRRKIEGKRKPRRTLGGEALEAPEPLGLSEASEASEASRHEDEAGREAGSSRRRRDEVRWSQRGKADDGAYTSKRTDGGAPRVGWYEPEEKVARRNRAEAEVTRRWKRKTVAKKGERRLAQRKQLEEERARKRREVDKIVETRRGKDGGEVRWSPYRKRVRSRARRREGGKSKRGKG
jgi:hypothetical protein